MPAHFASPDPVIRRIIVFGGIAAALILLWKLFPGREPPAVSALPRTVAARGDLQASTTLPVTLQPAG